MSSKTDTVELAISKVLELEAGPELDELVFLCPVNESPEKIGEITTPSRCLESALRIFSGHCYGICEPSGITFRGSENVWRCIFGDTISDAETIPLAVCRAFVADNCWFVLGDYDGYPDESNEKARERILATEARFMQLLGLNEARTL